MELYLQHPVKNCNRPVSSLEKINDEAKTSVH